jgi:amino acid permease
LHSAGKDDEDAFHSGADISATTTTVGLVNGMISGAGICVVLPQLGMQAGWLTTLWVCVLTGFISYYTAKLIVIHLGKGSQIRDCILAHFK